MGSEASLTCPPLTSCWVAPWDFPVKSAGVDCHFLLQGIFPTQELNLGLPHCRQTLYCLSHQGRLCLIDWGHLGVWAIALTGI